MTRARFAGGALAAALVLLALAAGYVAWRGHPTAPTPAPEAAPTTAPGAPTEPAPPAQQGFLYGRVTTHDGAVYEGRLRWGGNEEAFWDDLFNGTRGENPWAALVPDERLPTERRAISIFGFELAVRERPLDLGRPFVARFGDLTRIEADGGDLWATLKSGTVVHLDRFAADDFADGVRVWDAARGVVDLEERRMRAVDLLPTPRLGAVPQRLHGTVHTRQGDFTGSIQWDLSGCVGDDELAGRTPEGEIRLRLDAIRALARRSPEGVEATLTDGRQVVVTGSRETGPGNRGIYVEDRRFGRVRIGWDAFVRLEFDGGGESGESGPAYADFPPGSPLAGTVTTRGGRRLTGRLVYDLDESETTDTLDAPDHGVDYALPFALVASIEIPGGEGSGDQPARVTLHSGEQLRLERKGDLGDGNAGMLVFVEGEERPEYVPWGEVARVDLERPAAALTATVATNNCHLQANSNAFAVGQRVRAGQVTALANTTGNVTGPHLHLNYNSSQTGGKVEYFTRTDDAPSASELNPNGC